MKLIDITGQRFGRLTVVSKMAPRKGGGSDWQCVCDCGATCSAIGSNLRRGGRASCGCLAIEWARSMGANRDFIAKRTPAVTKHGHKPGGSRGSLEYRSWLNMKSRCQRPTDKDYPRYGGRGIKVCEAWDASFETFLADMGPRPSVDHGIDRERPNEDYKPGNCRWATKSEGGAENKRSNRPVTVGDLTFQSIAEAARHFGVSPELAQSRVGFGVPLEIAVAIVGRIKTPRARESYLRKDRRAALDAAS